MSQYYYRIYGVKFGPMSLELLQHEIASGQLLGGHEVRAENESNWTTVADFVSRRIVDRDSEPLPVHSIPTWDGGHDDIETVDVGSDVQSSKSMGIWFCRGSRVGKGPYNFDELISFARREELVADDELSLTDHGPWTPVRSIGRLMAEIPHPVVTGSVIPLLTPALNATTERVSQTTLPVSTECQLVSADNRPVLSDHPPQPGNTGANTQWYVRMGHVEHGPIGLQKMIEMVEAGRILPMDRVRQSHESEWTQAHAIPALFPTSTKANQTGSTFSLKSVRPTIPIPQTYAKRGGYSAHVVPIPPIMPAPVQNVPHTSWPPTSSPLPTQFAVQPPARTAESPLSPDNESRALVGGSVPSPVSSRPSAMVHIKNPPGPSSAERNADVDQSSEQPINDLSRRANGESKHKLRRGQFKEPQLVDGKNLIMVVGVLLAMLFAWRSLMTANVGDFFMPYSELSAIHRTLEEKRSENQTMELWAFARKEVVYKIESIKQKIKNLNSKHPIRNMLLSFADSLVSAAKSTTQDDVTIHMKDANKLLFDSSKEFRKWKDEEFQREMQKKRRPSVEAQEDR